MAFLYRAVVLRAYYWTAPHVAFVPSINTLLYNMLFIMYTTMTTARCRPPNVEGRTGLSRPLRSTHLLPVDSITSLAQGQEDGHFIVNALFGQ
jgi:hypothetical protein